MTDRQRSKDRLKLFAAALAAIVVAFAILYYVLMVAG